MIAVDMCHIYLNTTNGFNSNHMKNDSVPHARLDLVAIEKRNYRLISPKQHRALNHMLLKVAYEQPVISSIQKTPSNDYYNF